MLQLYSLFGYERDGGYDSPLWSDPTLFAHEIQNRGAEYQERYKAWLEGKRKFTHDEIVEDLWVKVGGHGYHRHVRFHPDGTLTEGDLFTFNEDDYWGGSWKLAEGVLQMNVSQYELVIFASRDGLHSGVEDADGSRFAYQRVVQVITEPDTPYLSESLEAATQLNDFLMNIDE